MKLQDARRDYYRRRAQKEGYRSRASFKLLQINNKYNILKKGNIVVEFGCAPGGWLQVASDQVGPLGFVLGLDLKKVTNMDSDNLKVIISDVTSSGLAETVLRYLPGRAKVVLSDLSPNVSGVWELDHVKQIDMSRKVVSTLTSILSKDGKAVLKAFEGADLKELVNELRYKFARVEVAKPSASRGRSSEVYLVCIGFSCRDEARKTKIQELSPRLC